MEIETSKAKEDASSSSSEEDEKEKKSMLIEGEEDEDEEEDDSATEELDDAEHNELQEQVQYLAVPTEAKETIRKPSDADKYSQKINTSKIQAAVDSFFAISIRKGWQGVAYLLLQNGYNLMEAIKDALNENQFKYVLALMTKIQDATLRQTDQKEQNLFHIFAAKGHRAPSDITTKIFEGFMVRGVDYKAIDSTGRTPLHYATESNFGFLEDKLLENKVDGNLLDNTGKSILHLALLRNNLTRQKLQKFFDYKIDLNTKFIHYIRQISPLHYVAENSNYELEKEMLLLGADPNTEDDKGLTPFQKIFIQNSMNLDRFQLYIQAYANLNKLFALTYKIFVDKKEEEVQKTYTLLHFAAEKGWSSFEDHLLMYGADASIENNEGKTAFDIALSQVSHELTLERLRLYILCKAPIKKPNPIQIRKKTMHVSPVIYLMNLKHRRENLVILKELLDSGVSVNDVDDDGWSAITYAIRKNSILHLRIFLSYPNLDRNMRDKQGKTPIHHVVTPMDYASYDNVEMLQLLAMYFDINALDDRKKPPIYYAHFQDSGVMKNALLQLGAVDQKPASELQRQATSIIAGVDWAEEVDYEADAERYIAAEEAKKMDEGIVEKAQPDERAQNRHNLEVVYDDDLGPYSLFMTKVDIKKGTYGEYLFYRMQVLYDKNRENYILFTKWGRIGDDGMYQQTPFPSKEETIHEFCKTFKDKSGNDWKEKANFQKKDGKYKLLNTSSRKSQKDYVQPIDWTAKTLPKSQMDIPIRKVIRAISEVKIYRDYFGRHNIDQQLLPFGKLTKDLIFEAKRLLLDIKELLEEIQERPSATDEDVEILIKLKEKLTDRSSKFYELIPDSRFRHTPIRPIDNMGTLNEKVNLVNDMLDFEVSSKILLGALNNIRTKNPLDYCFEALNIRLLTLNKAQREHKLIEQYIKNGAGSQGVKIEKIFALERRGEAERISQWKDLKNRTYLWHGSKVINFMGILSQGLRIAPPEAPATGYMFGKGIYFADTFAKSYGYCSDWNRRGDDSKFLLLCEVALGDSLEQFSANYVTKLDAPYKSVKGCGRTGPDPASNIVLANGAIVPMGTQINYEYHNMFGQRIQPTLNYNEYIVYDISQVRMRYLIQVK